MMSQVCAGQVLSLLTTALKLWQMHCNCSFYLYDYHDIV